LRFWESARPFIVLGKIRKLEQDVHVDRARQDGIPILRRSSGGGTVVQGKGCFNFTLVLSKGRDTRLHDIRKSYRVILDELVAILKGLGVDAVFQPVSDLALAGSLLKFSGNAQHRGRNFIMHHGTILYDFDLSLIGRYLTMPDEMPEYRRQRAHHEFVVNIPVAVTKIKEAMYAHFAVTGIRTELNAEESLRLRQMLGAKSIRE